MSRSLAEAQLSEYYPMDKKKLDWHLKQPYNVIQKLMETHLMMIDMHSQINHLNWDQHFAKGKITSKAHREDEIRIVITSLFKLFESPSVRHGDVCEFGCYTGISSAKLSLVCALLNTKLHVFDSFQGLPDIQEYGSEAQKDVYKQGQYCCNIDTVRQNIETYGIYGKNVSLVEGWFSDTLPKYDKVQKISFAFIDVDLVKSLEECLEFILPKLVDGGMIISHEAQDPDYLPVFEKFGLLDKEKYESSGVGTGVNVGAGHNHICKFRKLKETRQ